MYVLVRADIGQGLQMAQACHAAVELTLRHPDTTRATPNTVVLSVADEEDLLGWYERIADVWPVDTGPVIYGDDGDLLPHVLFTEPDLGGAATALACFSTGEAFSALPLAGREPAMESG